MGRGAEERGGDSAGVQPQGYEGTHPQPRALGQGRVQGAEGGTWGGQVSAGEQVRWKMSLRVRPEPAGKGLECQMKGSQRKCFQRER